MEWWLLLSAELVGERLVAFLAGCFPAAAGHRKNTREGHNHTNTKVKMDQVQIMTLLSSFSMRVHKLFIDYCQLLVKNPSLVCVFYSIDVLKLVEICIAE